MSLCIKIRSSCRCRSFFNN